jgi:regulator of protease activity HflC (stomatin/prohibitin superfamily)
MTEFFQWLITIIDSLRFWFFVQQDEIGVLLRCGKYKKSLAPGGYFVFPIIDSVKTQKSSICVVNLPNQSIISMDKKIWASSGVVRYQITDARIAILEIYDVDAAIQNVAMECIAQEMFSFNEETSLELINASIRDRLETETSDFGIKILSFNLTDLVPHKVFRFLSNDIPQLGFKPN